MKFWKIIKYLSTFYIRFKRTVSNQRNVHRRFPTTSWIEDRSVLTCARAPLPKNLTKLPKNYDIHSDPREIDQWSYEWKCFSVISCVMPEMVFCIYIWLNQFIPVHFYALASHCIYILSCWKIEAYNVLVKFTFSSLTANGGVDPPKNLSSWSTSNIRRGPWNVNLCF